MNVVHLQVDSAIAQITLDHPVNNRINFQMRQELLEAIEQVATSDARVLVIKAAGENFSLGGDARDWPGVSVAELRPKIEVFAKVVDRLQELEIPTIASVQGGCMGGGFELALGCDLTIAGRSARFAFPEGLVGILTLQGGYTTSRNGSDARRRSNWLSFQSRSLPNRWRNGMSSTA